MSELRLLDKTFSPYLNADEIALRVKHLAEDLERDYASRKVLFVSVLNGAFMFTSDLMKALDLSLEISFIKVSSFEGMASTGKVKEIIGLKNSVEGRHVIVLEDIVDTGTTLLKIDEIFKQKGQQWKIASLFYKPESYKGSVKVNFVGFEIPNDFIVGYGLDYQGFGRNLKNVYQLAKA